MQFISNFVSNKIQDFGMWVLGGIVGASYSICLTVAMVALILYIAGLKKAAKYIPISFIVFYLLQSLKAAF